MQSGAACCAARCRGLAASCSKAAGPCGRSRLPSKARRRAPDRRVQQPASAPRRGAPRLLPDAACEGRGARACSNAFHPTRLPLQGLRPGRPSRSSPTSCRQVAAWSSCQATHRGRGPMCLRGATWQGPLRQPPGGRDLRAQSSASGKHGACEGLESASAPAWAGRGTRRGVSTEVASKPPLDLPLASLLRLRLRLPICLPWLLRPPQPPRGAPCPRERWLRRRRREAPRWDGWRGSGT
mmetsp:Transcript_54175/g.117023  ORF Transcript_54175/g.117023 Transcript_54175/m.117023 type:complete len:239 (+) Transcript_54175:1242-1958(+)